MVKALAFLMALFIMLSPVILVAFLIRYIIRKQRSSRQSHDKPLSMLIKDLEKNGPQLPSASKPSNSIGYGLPYHRKDFLFTRAERSFYGILLNAVRDHNFVVFAKVRLGDLLYIPRGTRNWQHHWNKIQSKHIDFIICEVDSVKPLLAIELNDSSHNRFERMQRDIFVERALSDAGLPLLCIPAKHSYNVEEVSHKINSILVDYFQNA